MSRRPYARTKRYGVTPTRSGASTTGQMASWVNSVISQTLAEREKARVSERAVDLYTNDAMAHGLLESLIVEAVGVGLSPQFAPDHDALGQSQDWGIAMATAQERLWNSWGLDCRNHCDAQRRLNIYLLQQVLYFSWKLSGIGLAQVRIKQGPGRPSPLAVLPLDPSRLVTPTDVPNVYDGVEVDEDGAPVRVWLVRPEHMACRMYSFTSGQCQPFDIWDQTTGLPLILIVTAVRNIAEYRQDSILGSMITELRNNGDFVGASLVRAMIANLFVMFLENSGADAKTNIKDRVALIEQGVILQGGQREIPHFFTQQATPDGYREMFDAIVDRLGMATSRGAENVTRKYQASYSASKASMVKAQQVNAVDHMTLVNGFCQPMRMWLIYRAALEGRLDVPSTATLVDNLYFLSAGDWLPQPMPEIDRLKRANAVKVELETGQTTRSEIHGERSRNWREVRRQQFVERQYDRDLEQEFGFSLNPEPQPTGPDSTEGSPVDGSDLETA